MADFSFVDGNVPSAAQWNSNVRDQLCVICTSSTRPASPATGRVIYETDTNREFRYDGSAWQQVGQLGAWTTFTPTWTAATTNPVLGNGTIGGRYQRLFGRTYLVQYNVTAGSTTTFGSGQMKLSLPNSITASTYHAGVGSGTIAATVYTIVLLSESNAVLLYAQTSSLNAVTATQPGTWTTGNYLYASIVVESTT